MNLKEFEKKHILTISIILFVISVCGIAFACQNQKKYMRVSNNKYNMAFYELVDEMGSVENYLVKSLITNDSQQSTETLMYIWREANLSQVYLSQIPISNEGLSNAQKFLNQVSDYSYSLVRKSIKGEKLTQKELDNLKELYNYSTEVNSTLNQLLTEVSNGSLNWKELENVGSSIFNKEIENPSKDSFNSIEDNFKEYDGLIYDGAYSEHITSVEKKGLTGTDITEEDAKKIAVDFAGNDNIKEITSMGLAENGEIIVYTFEIKTNQENNITIAITKKGGHILFMNYNRNVTEEKIDVEEADKIATKFLEQKNFENMKKTYYTKEAGVLTINYAYEENDVIVYTDLIKVKIALDNGDILGIETTGYLNNHEKRNINKTNIISINQAIKMANNNLKIDSSKLAIIPTEFKTEIFCWELKGKIENRDFLLYVNAKTGKVEDILVIIESESGVLTQ